MPPLRRYLTVEEQDGVTIARLTMNVRTSLQINFDQTFQEILSNNPKNVVLDMSSVEYFHSAGISFLIRLNSKLSEVGGKLRLCNLQPQAIEVLSMTGVNEVLDIRTSEQAALNAFAESAAGPT